MKYERIADTGIEVSKICIGGMGFGKASPDFHEWTIDQDATTEVLKAAFNAGINFIDTANCYSHGTSEEYIARAIKTLGIPREKVVLASKGLLQRGKAWKGSHQPRNRRNTQTARH